MSKTTSVKSVHPALVHPPFSIHRPSPEPQAEKSAPQERRVAPMGFGDLRPNEMLT